MNHIAEENTLVTEVREPSDFPNRSSVEAQASWSGPYAFDARKMSIVQNDEVLIEVQAQDLPISEEPVEKEGN